MLTAWVVSLLQRLLPRCNVASMVALQPQMFLARTPDQLEAQVGSAYDIIQRDLPVTYVDAMIQVCPQHQDLLSIFAANPCLGGQVRGAETGICHNRSPALLPMM